MPNLKQFVEAVERREDVDYSGMPGWLAIAKRLVEAEELLRELEWVDSESGLRCPCCGLFVKKGHSKYCDLAKFLGGSE